MSNTALMVASSDEHFREMVRDNLLNIPNAKIIAEYQEVAANLYIRVLQDLERHPQRRPDHRSLGRSRRRVKALEKVKQAAPDLYVMASQLSRRWRNRDRLHARRRQRIPVAAPEAHRIPRRHQPPGARAAHAPRRGESKLGKVYTFMGTKGGVGTTSLAVNFAAVLAQRKQNTV